MPIFNDWVWKPDENTSIALRRGDLKVRAYNAESKNLMNFHLEPRRYLTEKEIEQRNKDRDLIRTYLDRVAKIESGVISVKTVRGEMNKHIPWVIMIDQSNGTARAVSKHETDMAARQAGAALSDNDGEYTVVQSSESLHMLSDTDVDALLMQFNDQRTELHRPLKELIVRGYLEQFDPTWHEADGSAKNEQHYTQPALPPSEIDMETQTSSNKTTASRGKKKTAASASNGAAKKKAAAPASAKEGVKKKAVKADAKKAEPKARAKLQNTGDGLGREGTPARFIREQYKAGKETKEIFSAVVKKFPDNDIKSVGYVSWYYNDMVKRGLLKSKASAKA